MSADSDDGTPTRLRSKASWLLTQSAVYAHQLVSEAMTPAGDGYHYRLLLTLDELGPGSQAALGQRTGIHVNDVVATATELADRGLVERAPDPADQRSNIITISRAGRHELYRLDKLLSEVQDELLAPLVPDERTALVRLLGQVLDYHTRRTKGERPGAFAAAATEPQEQLRYQATHDPLTGLANRAAFVDRLSWFHQGDDSIGGALLMLDLDKFKHINDTYGHPVGDQLLIQTAQRLVEAAPPKSTLARLGGDEFVILVEIADRNAAERIGERVLTALREPYQVDGRHLQTTGSVGVRVIAGVQALSSEEILRDADAALYEAKEAGRDRVVVHEPSKES